MAITRQTTIPELAGLVTEKLKEHGLSVLLVGGAVVSIYTNNKYESGDLDFVIEDFVVKKGTIESAMAELGLYRDRARVYLHDECRYAIDFCPPPASIGEEVVRDPAILKVSTGRVRIYTPTQSVMDRLAAFYHFGDTQGLEQALMVAEVQEINLEKIRSWSKAEGKFKEFLIFERRLSRLA